MAQITIGGVPYTVDLPNFKAIRAIWPHVKTVQSAEDPMDSIDAVLAIIQKATGASGLDEKLTPAEMAGIRPFMKELMAEISPKGEVKPAEGEASPSTATSTDSSSPSPAGPEAPTGT